MAVSTAISPDRISRVIGYELNIGFFNEVTQNLPQRIAIFAEANNANQANVTEQGAVMLSESQAGETYGFGSPIHQIMRILRPRNGGGVGSVVTAVYPQAEAQSAVAATQTITVTGTATQSGTHTITINGRNNVDGENYSISVVSGDTNNAVAQKIRDAVNNVLGSPVTATVASNVVTLTCKWRGASSDGLDSRVLTGGQSLGMTYAVATGSSGAGAPDISDALAAFGNTWNTIVINAYDTTSILNQLEQFNGTPEAANGRYTGNIWRPFVSFFGMTSGTFTDYSAIGSARRTQVTNVICPAPNSQGFSWEAAANMAAIYAPLANANPHSDSVGATNGVYPDMPTAVNAGDFASYETRDFLSKNGSSTVDIVNGRYQVQELITTYHPQSEGLTPAYRYVRDLVGVDFNSKFGIDLLEQRFLIDQTVANDNDTVIVSGVIKPKQWRQIVSDYLRDLSARALIADADFSINSLRVQISTTNPNRIETAYDYRRTGVARVISTTATAGFNFGTAQ